MLCVKVAKRGTRTADVVPPWAEQRATMLPSACRSAPKKRRGFIMRARSRWRTGSQRARAHQTCDTCYARYTDSRRNKVRTFAALLGPIFQRTRPRFYRHACANCGRGRKWMRRACRSVDRKIDRPTDRLKKTSLRRSASPRGPLFLFCGASRFSSARVAVSACLWLVYTFGLVVLWLVPSRTPRARAASVARPRGEPSGNEPRGVG